MSRTPLPNFFIVGAGKAGTTSLHHYLAQHPEVYMSPVKEPCYFASEIRPAALCAPIQRHVQRQSRALPRVLNDGKPVGQMSWLACEWDEYVRLFGNVRDEIAIGEASAAYLWSETAAENIRAEFPDARIVMMLRDPAERAYSQYLHQVSVGLTRATFREHIQACLVAHGAELGIHHPFLEIGLYAEQVKRYLARFPADHIRIYWYDEAWRRPDWLFTDLFQFLGVDAAFRPDTSHKNHERRAPRWAGLHYILKKLAIWYPLRALVPARLRPRLRGLTFRKGQSLAMDPVDRRFLVDYYRDDIRHLASLMDRDLGAWLSSSKSVRDS